VVLIGLEPIIARPLEVCPLRVAELSAALVDRAREFNHDQPFALAVAVYGSASEWLMRSTGDSG
jgi:hypothetical protein